ncbi:hypothetical protein MASR1M6_27110 [Rubrivivax sp.]
MAAGGSHCTSGPINPPFTATKHVNGVPCRVAAKPARPSAAWATNPTSYSAAADATSAVQLGLDVPTGGLTASWTIINVPLATSYLGVGDAVEATDANGIPGWGNVVFSPQLATPWASALARLATADPLLRGGVPRRREHRQPGGRSRHPGAATGATTYIAAAMYDFPDLSTPYLQCGEANSCGYQASMLTSPTP